MGRDLTLFIFSFWFNIVGLTFTSLAADRCISGVAGEVRLNHHDSPEALFMLQSLLEISGPIQPGQKLYLSSIHSKQQFQDYLIRLGLAWNRLSESERQAVVFQFAHEVIQHNKESTDLNLRRARSLYDELRHRGTTFNHRHRRGYFILRRLSKENLNRETRFVKSAFKTEHWPVKLPERVSAKIQSLVDDFAFHYVHNTTVPKGVLAAPLLSSRVIHESGLARPLNALTFNTDTLKSDNNVFFHAIPRLKSLPAPFIVSQYGETNLVVEQPFASKHGWISPFVMYKKELLDLAESRFPEVKNNENLKEMTTQLSQFDLSPHHGQKLFRLAFQLSLERLFIENPESFWTTVGKLETESLAMKEYFEEHVFAPLGFAHGWELKIPVAVPVGQIKVVVNRRDSNPLGTPGFGFDFMDQRRVKPNLRRYQNDDPW